MHENTRILVVDDDADLRDLLVLLLTREGYDVLCAESGLQALECLETAPVDLVLLDVMLPDQDGFDTCAQIHMKTNVPVIFLSARLSEKDVQRGYENGGTDYVSKPFHVRDLVDRVQAALV
jgi:two-component system OmpR family response regulator